MQITIEDISPVEKRVDFEVPWPDVAAKLGEDLMWTHEAEVALIDHCWKQA